MVDKRIDKNGLEISSRIRDLVFAGVSAICLVSCQPNAPLNTRARTAVTNNAKEYYFVMQAAQQRELLRKVAALKLGDLRFDVIARLGKPSYDREDVTKDGKRLGRTVKYYLKILQKDLVSEKYDKLIRLEFDTSDRLTRIKQPVGDPP